MQADEEPVPSNSATAHRSPPAGRRAAKAETQGQIALTNETAAPATPYVPHIELVLQALRVHPDRLSGRSKIAVEARLLRMLLQHLVSTLPFDATFYRANYPDIDASARADQMPDLHRHFIENGFFEGRLGAPPEVDEPFYLRTYPDVADAIARGDVRSASEHYIHSGAAEGRVPNPALRPQIDDWMAVLRAS